MKKTLVAYFSAGGTTEQTAKRLAEAAGAGLYEIKPAVPYTSADLNWMDKKSRSSVEMNDRSFRPELADKDADIASHDRIFLGFPIWWYVLQRSLIHFLESYDFTGKEIILFATSEEADSARQFRDWRRAAREQRSGKGDFSMEIRRWMN